MANVLKCPHCGEVFEVDEAGYAAILNQVRTAEFEEELSKREDTLRSQLRELQKVQQESAKLEYDKELSKKDAEIKSLEDQKQAEIDKLNDQIAHLNSDKEKDVQLAEEKAKSEMKDQLNEKDKSISELQSKIAQLNDKIVQLNSEKQNEVKLAIADTQNKQMKLLNEKELEIANLENKVKQTENETQIALNNMKEKYDSQLEDKNEMIERLKDMKVKLSTKMLGEDLEKHCSNAFNMIRMQAYPNAYFEKDNDAIKEEGETKGTKGDFIFRDYAIDGDEKIEYISIMFEMKNEADETATKKKNEDFFDKLDKDRRKKNCEYAVLVSMLEQDSELYNEGIVDVSYRHPKMFVVRPQFFLPIIALLCNASRNTIPLKKELDVARRRDIDVTNFENKLSDFKKGFNQQFQWATNNLNDAISEIDKIIKSLTSTRDELILTGKQLNYANNKAIGLTVRGLTTKNPTMKKKFEEARKHAEDVRKYAEDVEEEENLEEDFEEEEFDNVTPAESFGE